ncbi:hypothetical protein, partial [Blastomonas sp. CCH5-E3]|uniref:hypothetical protein n=1 Tax=Blastomonas sp. CCH5-E3 TaxID=1768750 RepID=UPI001E48F836
MQKFIQAIGTGQVNAFVQTNWNLKIVRKASIWAAAFVWMLPCMRYDFGIRRDRTLFDKVGFLSANGETVVSHCSDFIAFYNEQKIGEKIERFFPALDGWRRDIARDHPWKRIVESGGAFVQNVAGTSIPLPCGSRPSMRCNLGCGHRAAWS